VALSITTNPALLDAETPTTPMKKAYTVQLDSTAIADISKKYDVSAAMLTGATTTVGSMDDGDLWPSEDEITLRATLAAGIVPLLEDPGEHDTIFFSSENNAVIRSFESSRGKGLAGAITSMNFDWNRSTWETRSAERPQGSVAPKFCTVSIQFAPIHDITPGLDSDGFNRAPIYNVGKVMNGIAGDVYDKKDDE
jgi:hypothetical protein